MTAAENSHIRRLNMQRAECVEVIEYEMTAPHWAAMKIICANILGCRADEASLVAALLEAEEAQVQRVRGYLDPYITYMKKYPHEYCESCGQIIPGE